MIFVLCVFGLFPLLAALLPIPAIVPVLLFIGLVDRLAGVRRGAEGALRGGRAGRDPVVGASGARAWCTTRCWPPGTSVEKVGADALANGGVLYGGLATLGAGSVLVGMVLGTIAVFVIDRRFIHAAAACGVGGVLTLVGLIHGEEVHVFSNPRIALGYGLAAVVCLGYAALRLPPRELDLSRPDRPRGRRRAERRFEREEERVAVPA